jgi:mannose-6-phosphate isomerase
MECMATSDNVIRVGLTPKLRDIPTLISMLTYTSLPPSSQLLQPVPFPHSKSQPSKTVLFDPPIDEFSVASVRIESGEKETHQKVDGPSILINTEGFRGSKLLVKDEKGVEVVKEELVRVGQVFFLAAGYELEIEGGEDGLSLFRAFVEGFEEKDE